MDIHTLEYILAIAQEGNISHAANRVFITQSALNQQLLKLEAELRTPLFTRSGRMMIPTYAGRIYIENGKKIKAIKEDTYRAIADVANDTKGEISLSFTPERGARMFAAIYPAFHKEYPGYTFKIRESRSIQSDQLLRDGTVRLANSAIYRKSNEEDIISIIFGTEPMVLAVPASHPLASLAGEDSYKRLPHIDLRLFKDVAFVLNSRETRMRTMADHAFADALIKPEVLFESSNSATIIQTVKSQMGAGFIPVYYARKEYPVVYFTVGQEYSWSIGVSYKKETHLSNAEKRLITLMKEYHIHEMDDRLN